MLETLFWMTFLVGGPLGLTVILFHQMRERRRQPEFGIPKSWLVSGALMSFAVWGMGTKILCVYLLNT